MTPAKTKTAYQCAQCGATVPKWVGQCPDCAQWNTLEEVVLSRPAAVKRPRSDGFTASAGSVGIQLLSAVDLAHEQRMACGIGELDRVLGGGVVAGSVVLLGGDPGIGKSTLLLQVTSAMSGSAPCLYVTGEESLRQVGMRARRLGLDAERLHCLVATCVEQILELLEKEPPRLLVIDSIQTIFTEQLQSAPGSVAQVREAASMLVRYAKRSGTAIFLVGHVTKGGALAGPRVLEHMVDAVLYFEGDGGSRYRVIRAVKNRFGAVNELGVFAMTDNGLREVSNPSAIFLSGRRAAASGSAITVIREGTRPLLVEVQALVDQSHLGNPRRVTVGMEQNRLAILLAVLHRQGGIALHDQDVFVNVVGGIRISETGADLPVMLAVYSSFRDRCLPAQQVIFGEVGLSGEIRPVYNGEERLREAAHHGFSSAIVARANAPKRSIKGMRVIAVERVGDALDALN